MAPAYANIYVSFVENEILAKSPFKIKTWKRYIDDIFCIMSATDQEIYQFQQWINTQSNNLKFTLEYDPKGIPFLDTFVTHEDNKIILKPHTKPTDTKQYINPESCHPKHVFESLPYSQALRLKRICTKEKDLTAALANLKDYLTNRNYNIKSIENNIRKIYTKRKNGQTKNTTNTAIIIPYHPTNPPIARKLHELWSKHKDNLPRCINKPITAYKRPKNLKELLTRARYRDNMDMLPIKHKETIKMEKRKTDKFNINYDKNQLRAPITHIQQTCQCGWNKVTDSYSNLQEIFNEAQQCPKTDTSEETITHHIRTLPVIVTTATTIHCNECKYRFVVKCHLKQQTLEEQIRLAVHINNRRLPNPSTCVTKCNYKYCTTCRMAYKGNIIRSHHNDKIATMPFKCSASNIIYAIHCSKCNLWYIGYTTHTLKERLSIHKSSIKRKDNTAIAKHFNMPGHAIHAHMKITILDTSQDLNQLKIKEALWIDKMNAINYGINERDEASHKLHPNTNIVARHFKHSQSSFPYFTSIIESITYNPLTQYKRKLTR
jgi:hypothetical protein